MDKKVRSIKSEMTGILLKKNPDYKPEEIEKIFHRYDNVQGTVNQTLDKAKTQYQSVQLASILGKKMELDLKSKMEESQKQKEGLKGPKTITEELYGGPLLNKRSRPDGMFAF